MQRDALPAAIDDFDWDIDDESTRRDGTQPGEILETRPAAGEILREGDTLTVVVSEGATLVDVPAGLVGMPGDEAAAALEAAGFVPELIEQQSTDVDEGLVIGFADGDPGGRAPNGSTIRLTVSSGEEFEMPDVTGRPYADAVATALRRRARRAGRRGGRRRRRARHGASAPIPSPATTSSRATRSRSSWRTARSRSPSCGGTASTRPPRSSRSGA